MVFRWEAPLFFANAGMFRQQVRSLVREQQARWVVLQCEAITDIDVTAAEMLDQLDTAAQRAGRPPGVRRAANPVARPGLRYGLFETLDRDHFYPSIEAAIAAIAASDAKADGGAPPRGEGRAERSGRRAQRKAASRTARMPDTKMPSKVPPPPMETSGASIRRTDRRLLRAR